MTEVSSTRLYLGNLPRTATKADVEAHFATHGTGEITEIKLMNGFGFIEYKDAMDARDVVPAFHGSDFMGERLTDLKDFARQSGCDVVYSETGRNGNGEGFVEFETAADLKNAIEKLDGREFKGQRVTCTASVHTDFPPRDRARSRSPRRGGFPPMPEDGYRRGPPMRGDYSPRRDGGYREAYRDRSPPRRDYYDDRRGGYRSPPRRGPVEDYPPRRYEDPYRGAPRGDYPPEPAPYMNGRAPYEHRRAPPSDFPPARNDYPREAYPRDYDRRY
ncbi:hypothetical protein OQA88_9061 [Cercophora sp. LCS_1]